MAKSRPASTAVAMVNAKGYTVPFPVEDYDRIPKARGHELDISFKHAVEITRTIRGMPLPAAKVFLEDVIDKRAAVPVKRFNRGVPHRKGTGFGAGRYPLKAAGAILQVLLNAENNAEVFGLDPEELRVKHIAAHKGAGWMGHTPRAHGRSTARKRDRVNVEVVLESTEATEG